MTDLFKVGLVALILSFGLAGPVTAGSPQEDGLNSYQREDYATALRLLRPLADQGDAFAQGLLGRMYTYGQGVKQDYAEAVKWFRKAADQGNALGQYEFGDMYLNGKGVK